MASSSTRWLSLAVLAAFASAGCRSAGNASASTAPQPATASSSAEEQGEAAAIARARADSARYPYTKADIDFMSGMIAHHAQAIVMAKWAPSHGASSSVRTLCDRIINAQRDEIRTMQAWLRDRSQPIPEPDTLGTSGMAMDMGGSGHGMMMMPGMLTDEQMKQLDAARGTDFDKLFLTDMIQHHRGAVSMVKDLFETNGAAQDEYVFKYASDVNVDQTTEIARMQRMLIQIAFQAESQ